MALPTAPRAAIYARVSTLDQEPENQLQELRRYVEALPIRSALNPRIIQPVPGFHLQEGHGARPRRSAWG